MMLSCRFLFVWLLLVLLNFSLKSVHPLYPRAFSYQYLDELKTFSMEEFLDKVSLIIFGNWLIICGGWCQDLLIYNSKSFDLLYDLYVPLPKLNVVFYNHRISFNNEGHSKDTTLFKYVWEVKKKLKMPSLKCHH